MNQGYPAIAALGTGVGSLVSVANYEQVTGDTVNSSQDLIDQAVIEVCQYCNRTLGYGQYTERLRVDRKGFCYPSALPLDPAGATTPAGTIQGGGIFVGPFTFLPDLPFLTGTIAPQATVSYYGGYQPYGTTTRPTPQLPPKLMRAVCAIAFSIGNPVVMSGMPAGATSVSLQGVSVSGSFGAVSAWQNDTGLVKTLTAYRRVDIPAFGN